LRLPTVSNLSQLAGVLALLGAAPLLAQGPVVIEHDHLIVESGPFALRITDIVMVKIAGPAALPAGQFHLQAPERAENLRLLTESGQSGPPVVVSGGALVNQIELPPGRHQFQFQYELVDAAPSVRVLLPRNYPTEAIDILLPSGPLAARATGLHGAGSFEVESRRFERLTGSNLPAGRPIDLILERPAPPERRRDPMAIGVMAAVAMMGALLVLRSVWLARRRADGGGRAAAN